MRAWNQPTIPSLPGAAPLPQIFDTAAQRQVELEREQQAGLYVCGITPYDATHMGHASTYVAFDVLNRAWRDAGVPVKFVQNVTDIDDPLLERAAATGVDWVELAEGQTELFRTDMEALNIIAPDHYVSVVDSIPLVVDAVEKLMQQGFAYRVPGFTAGDGTVHPDGDVYFDLQAAAKLNEKLGSGWTLGHVAHMNHEEMLTVFGERGGDPNRPGKKDALDPLLWRVERDGEPSWEGGELGAGRPGWHIECTVISQEFLGSPFSVQGGGSDLQFPHHDLGSSHGFALTGQPMARHYAHTGMVGLDGEKMSKSLGNLVLVSKLLQQGVHPAVIRLAIMDNHYRADWFWTDDLLQKAQGRFDTYVAALEQADSQQDEASLNLLEAVRELIADDLNVPAALVAIDQWAFAVLEHGGGGSQLVRDLLIARLGLAI